MFLRKLFLMCSFLLVAPLPNIAQTPTDLRQRYKVSSRMESFDVWPGIIATISYGADGKVACINLTPPVDYREDGTMRNEMSARGVQEVLNQLVPLAKRGAVCEDRGAVGSIYALNRTIDYENVSITTISRQSAVSSVFVQWTKCAGTPEP